MSPVVTSSSPPRESSLARSCIAPHLRCLRWCGFCRLGAGATTAQRTAHDAFRAFSLAATATYLLQECIYAYQERDDMEKLSQVMFLLLCHVTSIAKQLVFIAQAERIDALVDGLDDTSLRGRDSHARRLLRRRATSAFRLQRLYSSTAALTCSLWLVLTLLQFFREGDVEFPFWLPGSANSPIRFTVVLVYSYYVTTLVGIANTTMDAFIGSLLDQYSAQLQLLRQELVALSAVEVVGAEGVSALMPMFYESLDHYDKICSGVRETQSLFGGATLVQFTIGGWILCMAAYKVVSLRVASVQFASMLLFIVCILTELFVYCYFGNQLSEESALVSQALFSIGWHRWSGPPSPLRRPRRALLLAGERARRPLRVCAGAVVPLSLDTFLKILKSSYTFYAVLRQTK